MVGAQEQNSTRSSLTAPRATCSGVSSSEACQRQLRDMGWVIYFFTQRFQTFRSDLPAASALTPEPAAEVRVLFIHHDKLCAGAVSDKAAPVALGRQGLPAGTSFHRGHPGADRCNNCSHCQPPTASSPKHSSSFQLP